MSKILIAFFNAIDDLANANGMPCFYESFIQELSALGNSLLVYHHGNWEGRWGKLPFGIKKEIETFQPDVALIFNNNFYDLSEDFDFPIVVYEVDSVLYYKNIDILSQKKGRFKYLVPQRESIEAIHATLEVPRNNIRYLPFFTSIQREDVEKVCNISFIGTRFITRYREKTLWNDFMQGQPSAEDIKQFRNMMEFVASHPFLPEAELHQHFSSICPELLQWLKKSEILDTLSGARRILTLSAVSDLGLSLYGTKSWITENSDDPLLPLSFNEGQVYSIRHNQDIYNSSKLAINVNHLQAISGFSWRVCDIMASSACLVSEFKQELARNFPRVPLPTFTNRHEAYDICRKLLREDALREDIVRASNEAIEAGYRFKHLIPELEEFLGIRLFSDASLEKAHLTIKRVASTIETKSSKPDMKAHEFSSTSYRISKFLIRLASMFLFSRPERRMYRERKLRKLKKKYHIE